MGRIQNFEKPSKIFLGNDYWMILTKYKVNITNSNSRKSYFLSPLYFQNRYRNTKMRKTRQDEFLEFNGKHSDILQIFLHKNQKKHWRLYSVKPIWALSTGWGTTDDSSHIWVPRTADWCK